MKFVLLVLLTLMASPTFAAYCLRALARLALELEGGARTGPPQRLLHEP